MKILIASLAGVAALGLAFATSPAPTQNQSAKATMAFSDIALVNGAEGPVWTTVLSSSIKTSTKKDLFVDVALESGLVTDTTVASKGGKKDTSTAEAEVRVRVLVDGQLAYPGEVIFASRKQEMTAKFQGIIEECFSLDEETGKIVLDPDCVEAEELQLVLSTMSANSFNFICPNVGTGVHTCEVQVLVSSATSSMEGAANALATVGKGSCTVQEVRMAAGTEIDI